MRVPFVHRWLGIGHRDVGAEPHDSDSVQDGAAESSLPADLTGPVVLLPAEHILPQQETAREWWRKPGIYVGSAAILFVVGAGAGILVSKRGGGDSQIAGNDAAFRTGVSALTLPDEDLRIAPTARDSVPSNDDRPAVAATGELGHQSGRHGPARSVRPAGAGGTT